MAVFGSRQAPKLSLLLAQHSEEKHSLCRQHWTRGELCPATAPAQTTPQTQSVFTVLVWVNVTLLLPRP